MYSNTLKILSLLACASEVKADCGCAGGGFGNDIAADKFALPNGNVKIIDAIAPVVKEDDTWDIS